MSSGFKQMRQRNHSDSFLRVTRKAVFLNQRVTNLIKTVKRLIRQLHNDVISIVSTFTVKRCNGC